MVANISIIIDMKVKFLEDCLLPTKSTKYCGDGCCSSAVWEPMHYIKTEEVEAVVERQIWCSDGIVDISSLTFNKDYVIVEFP